MLTDDINKIKESKWLSITIQSSIIGLNSLFISQKGANSFLLISIYIVFSLFLLQATNHRYLYFNPSNLHVNVPTPSIDTFILCIFTFLSGAFFLFGITSLMEIEYLKKADLFLKIYILYILLFFDFLLPLCSLIFGKHIFKRLIARKLKKYRFSYIGNCETCECDKVTYENFVVAWNDLRILRKCKNCDTADGTEFKTNLQIG